MPIDQMRGMSSMDLKLRSIYKDGRLMPGEEHPSMLALGSGRPVISQQMGIYRSDGSLVWLNVNAQPLVSKEKGEITGVVTSFFDVTAIRNAEEEIKTSLNEQRALNEELAASNEELAATNEKLAITQRDLQGLFSDLSESEKRFRTMAEDTDVLIAVADENGNGVYFNKAWQELTGRSIEELVSSGWAGLIHPDDMERCIDTYLTAFNKRVSLNGEFRILSKTGDYRWLLAKIPARFRPDGSFAGYISSCTDITDLKNEEQRKNDFIGMVSHELKTPLTSLNANLQMLQKKSQNAEDTFTTTALNKANKQVKKMTGMINGFLNIARLEAGKIYLEMEDFDLAALISEVKDEIGFTTNTHRIGFTFDGNLNVYADREKIGQVINNLLNNAIKYSPKETNIEITCSKGTDFAQVSIKDEGPGIKPNHIPQLFDRFYRVEDKDTKHISGFGIGLYLCAEIIKRHNGKIWVDSAEDKGSNFHFSLPLNLNK
jgi:two-component system sensor histidine kinase VicK